MGNRLARLRHGELGEDLLGSLDEVEVELGGIQTRVLLANFAGEVKELGEALHTREATAHGDERHEARALRRALGELGGAREVRDEVVAQVDGLFGGLEAHGVLGDAGDGERARHGAQGHHDRVGIELEGVAVRVGKRHALLGGVDGGDAGAHDARLLQVHGKRRLDVAGLDGARGDLGQEGLVDARRAHVDERDLGLPVLELLLEVTSDVEAAQAAAEDEDALHVVSP